MMKLHLLCDFFELVVAKEHGSTGVMDSEASDIEDIIFEDKEGLLGGIGVALDLLIVFKFDVDAVAFRHIY